MAGPAELTHQQTRRRGRIEQDGRIVDEFGDVDAVALTHPIIGINLSRLSEEAIAWATKEFSFVTLHDAYSTGSRPCRRRRTPDIAEQIENGQAEVAKLRAFADSPRSV